MAAAAASRSPAATTRRTTTASRWCWPAAPSTAPTSRACAGASRPRPIRRAPGAARRWTSRAEYRARIVGDMPAGSGRMKIVVDCGNGIPGASAPGILRALGNEVIELYSEVDGDFPNHHPDPSKPENLADLIRTVQAQRCRARPGLRRRWRPARRGHARRPDHLPRPAADALCRAMCCRAHRGASILFDVKCSMHLAPTIRRAGGVPLMWMTGHSLMKAKLKETGAPLAGEMSGHIFFSERWYGFDDATYTAARLLEILSRSKDPSAVLNALPTSFSTPELNVPCAEGEHHRVVQQAARTGAVRRRHRADHHRRPARRIRRRLRPGARVEHHAGAGAALRGRQPGRAAAHPGAVHGRAARGQARRADRDGRALTAPRASPRPASADEAAGWRASRTRRCCAR